MSAIGPAPRVYLVTDRQQVTPRALADVIEQALTAVLADDAPPWPPGALAVQLREKDLAGGALLEHARALRRLTAQAGVRLFVNDRVDVALAVGADGVHLGGGSLDAEAVHAIAPQLQIAASTHHVDDVVRAAHSARVSFVVFGPVFDTPSKQKYGPPLGLEKLREACALPMPVVAIGGIDIAKVDACRTAGASGIACIRAVLRNHDPASTLRRFFEAIEST